MGENDKIMDQMAAEHEDIERQWRDEAARVEAAAVAWRARWPNACTACKGHGGATFYETHGLPGPAERLFEACDALPEKTCHRCMADGLNAETGEGPCSVCGWNFDDGEPML